MKTFQSGEAFLLRGIEHRLVVLEIPITIRSAFLSDLSKWIINSGFEWSIKRLKSLKTDFIRERSGFPFLTWVRKNRKGQFYGWIGSLLKFSKKSTKTFNKTLQMLSCYSYFTSKKLLPSQKEKFLKAVKSHDTFIPPDLCNELRRISTELIGHRFIRPFPIEEQLLTYRGSPSKRAPIFGRKSVPQDSNLELELLWFDDFRNWSFYKRYWNVYSPVMFSLMRAFEESRLNHKYRLSPPSSWNDVSCGEVHFLQEPGFKCRSIASPYRIHQLALKPLGDDLYKLLKLMPWDCTHQQEKAFPVIQAYLKQNKTVHSIDLTSFTDLFPLRIQVEVLKSIYGDESDFVHAFETVSRGRWNSSIGEIRWTKGQPLGLYPSFAIAGLTHGLLLNLLSGVYHNQYFVLGDDVIILDDNLMSRYMKTLDLLSCPWSPDKTISSDKIAEFAGKIILSDAIIPQFKWRKVSDDNFIDICRNLGARVRSILSPAQREVFDAVKHYLPPIGLNISFGKDNLTDAVARTEIFMSHLKEKDPIGNLVDLKAEIDKKYQFKPESLYAIIDDYAFSLILSTFDEKVRRAFENTRFSKLINRCISFAKGVHDLANESRILPTPRFHPSYLTQLDRYRVLLGLN